MLTSIPWYYIVALAVIFVVVTQCVEETMVSGPFSKIAEAARMAAETVERAQTANVTVDSSGTMRETKYEGGVLLERITSRSSDGVTKIVIRPVIPVSPGVTSITVSRENGVLKETRTENGVLAEQVITVPPNAKQVIAVSPNVEPRNPPKPAPKPAPKPVLQVVTNAPQPLLSPSAMGPKTSSGLAPPAAKKSTTLAHSEVKKDDSFNLNSRRRQYVDLVNQHNKSKDKKAREGIADYLRRIRLLADSRGKLAALMKGMPQLK